MDVSAAELEAVLAKMKDGQHLHWHWLWPFAAVRLWGAWLVAFVCRGLVKVIAWIVQREQCKFLSLPSWKYIISDIVLTNIESQTSGYDSKNQIFATLSCAFNVVASRNVVEWGRVNM